MAEAIRRWIYMQEGRRPSEVHHETVCIIQSVIFFFCRASYPEGKGMNNSYYGL